MSKRRPVFITTSRNLPAHEDQRHRTLILISQFADAGQTRMADQNRVVLEQPDERIQQIKHGLAAQTSSNAC